MNLFYFLLYGPQLLGLEINGYCTAAYKPRTLTAVTSQMLFKLLLVLLLESLWTHYYLVPTQIIKEHFASSHQQPGNFAIVMPPPDKWALYLFYSGLCESNGLAYSVLFLCFIFVHIELAFHTDIKYCEAIGL